MEQTAVEWLEKELNEKGKLTPVDFFQAKEMEAKQRAKIRLEGYGEGYDEGLYDALNK